MVHPPCPPTLFRHYQMEADARAAALDAALTAPGGALDAAAAGLVAGSRHPRPWERPPRSTHGATRCEPVISAVWKRVPASTKPPPVLPRPLSSSPGTILWRRAPPTHPPTTLVVRRSRVSGLGLYTLTPIPANTIACDYAGERVRATVADARAACAPPHVGSATYLFAVPRDVGVSGMSMVIDATCRGGVARFVNHSCAPCLEAAAVAATSHHPARVLLMSRRPIDAGEELTYDYRLSGSEEGREEACACGAAACRRVL